MVRPTGQINTATPGWNAGRSIHKKKGRPYPGEYSILKGRCCHLDADGMDRSADFPDDGGRTPWCAPARSTCMMGSGGPCRIARPRPSADHAELSARWDGRSGRLDQVRSVPGTMKPEEKQPCSRHQHTAAGRCGSSRRETCAAEDSGSGVQHWTASPLILALPAISPTERAMMWSSDETNPHGPGRCRPVPRRSRDRPADSPHPHMPLTASLRGAMRAVVWPLTVTDGQCRGRR